ncbi:MAG: hypothetical protein PVI21_04990 [Candidatus Woesebacteria bacterium]|jgi:hypothetical protein
MGHSDRTITQKQIVLAGDPPKGRCENVSSLIVTGLYGFVVIDRTSWLLHPHRVEWDTIQTAQTAVTFTMIMDYGKDSLTVCGGRTTQQRANGFSSYRRVFIARTRRDVVEGLKTMQTISKLVTIRDNGEDLRPDQNFRSGDLATYIKIGRSVELIS